MDDATLIAQIQAGNEHANRFLIEKFKNLVWHLVSRMVSQPEDAEDLCQEIFLRVFRDIGKFRGESKLSTWIGAIAYNMSVTYLRKKEKISWSPWMITFPWLPGSRQWNRRMRRWTRAA